MKIDHSEGTSFPLEVKDIDVHHGSVQALWHVCLQVGQGELVSLIGANGAGKTTIVETIAGLVKPTAGTILFQGVRVDQEPTHKIVELGISLIPEDKGIFRGLSVLENLELGAFTPLNRKMRQETFGFVYGLFPLLAAREKQAAGTLSGGEQQMLAVGKALMGRPRLLMCDEPSLGLAPLVVKSIFKVIGQVNSTGVGVLLVEQNVRAALSLASRAFVIENGKVTLHGEAKDLANDQRVRSAYLGIA
ncbi:MAG: ABC transporter ATP-binding protein [Deltaproteobacteria bacterium]|nr:ABC transporter ATP-binding protein [Deltaproteobacteria bacterium]